MYPIKDHITCCINCILYVDISNCATHQRAVVVVRTSNKKELVCSLTNSLITNESSIPYYDT